MGLITKEVWVKWSSSNKKHYINKGYIYTKMKDKFIVKIEDLPNGSHALVDIQCDGCGKILKNVIWQNYINNKRDNNYYCLQCANAGFKKFTSFYNWCYVNLPKEEADKIMLRWDYEKNIKNGKVLSPKDVSYSSGGFNQQGYWFKCLDDPRHKSELKNINHFTHNEASLNCNQCNSIAYTHPYLIKYLVNPKDAYKYSYGSQKKILMKCLNCGCEKLMIIPELRRRGFSCPRCSDGISYPEKFMFYVLEQLLDKDFLGQLSKTTFKWCGDYKYDFYTDNNNINCIIETHGLQHYEDRTTGSWVRLKSLQEIQENDKKKEKLAKENGIKEYIIIDCRESNLEWIKTSIMQSKLPSILNFKELDIDWLKCHEYACKSLVKTVCDMWDSGFNNKNKIASLLKIHNSSVGKYLKQGAKLGWCNYDPNEESKKALLKMCEIRSKRIICITTGEIFDSIRKASKKYNINKSGIIECCKRKHQKTAGKSSDGMKLVWMYYDEYLQTINN